MQKSSVLHVNADDLDCKGGFRTAPWRTQHVQSVSQSTCCVSSTDRVVYTNHRHTVVARTHPRAHILFIQHAMR